MVATIILAAGAAFLLLMHRLARTGAPAGTVTAAEAFVFAHWPFFYLNAFIVAFTGGYAWATVDVLTWRPFLIVGLAGVLGLIAFMAGSWVARLQYRGWSPRRQFLHEDRGSLTIAGVAMAGLGLLSIVTNYKLSIAAGLAGRRTELLALGDLAVPGLVLIFGLASHPRSGRTVRRLAWCLFLLGVSVLLFAWSRRPLLLIVAVVILGGPLIRTGLVRRRRVAVAIAAISAAAVLLLLGRLISFYGLDLDNILQGGGIGSWYASKLWLESSAFSAAAWVVHEFGITDAAGIGSLVHPFVFWLPRSLFPWKPVGFEIGELLDLGYTIAPGIYGELIYDVSIVGLVPVMAILGYVIKSVDLRFFRMPDPSVAHRLFYLMFVFDVMFIVRGSFNAAVVPLIIHCVLSAGILWVVASAASTGESSKGNLSKRKPVLSSHGRAGGSESGSQRRVTGAINTVRRQNSEKANET